MHNDGSTENFDISGEFYVEHAGDTVLVAPGGYYHFHYEIYDRSVHLIAESSDSLESARTLQIHHLYRSEVEFLILPSRDLQSRITNLGS